MSAATDEEIASLSAAFREQQRTVDRVKKERDHRKTVRDEAQTKLEEAQAAVQQEKDELDALRIELKTLLNQA
jgi:chromosome segregation ATPase